MPGQPGPYLVHDPGAVEVSVLRGLPPAEARGGGAGAQRDLQGHQPGLVAAVAEQEVLEEAPGQPPVHRVLQEHGLGAGVRGRLATAQTQEELHESEGQNTHTGFVFRGTCIRHVFEKKVCVFVCALCVILCVCVCVSFCVECVWHYVCECLYVGGCVTLCVS